MKFHVGDQVELINWWGRYKKGTKFPIYKIGNSKYPNTIFLRRDMCGIAEADIPKYLKLVKRGKRMRIG